MSFPAASPLARLLRQTVSLLTTSLALFFLPAQAQTAADAAARQKLDTRLLGVVDRTATPLAGWLKQATGGPLVKVIVSTDGSDPLGLTRLLQSVLSLGGAVHQTYPSLNALAVMLPAGGLLTLAQDPTVVGITPNAPVTRSASLLQQASGSAEVPAASGFNPVRGLDGSGIGIAVLDSGIAWQHRQFASAGLPGLPGTSRVRQRVDLVALGSKVLGGGWKPGANDSALTAVSGAIASLPSALGSAAALGGGTADVYGHGTHVASIAAGQGSYQGPDASGIAPNATLYDVRVLGDDGTGSTSDVLAGIEWVIQPRQRGSTSA